MKTTSDVCRGLVSIALYPFWRFDAKGGEVVLLGSHGICMGWAQACLFIIPLLLVSLYYLLFAETLNLFLLAFV